MIEPKDVLAAVSKARPDRGAPFFCDSTGERPYRGGQCDVYRVGFEDSSTWAVRVPVRGDQNAVVFALTQEIQFLRLLESRGFEWSPRLVAEDTTRDNAMGYPFYAYEWVHGECLEWDAGVPARREDRRYIIRQLAKIFLRLLVCTRDYDSPRNFSDSLTTVCDQRIIRICRGALTSASVRDCLLHRALVSREFSKYAHDWAMFVDHGDIQSLNIIVNGTEVVGLIDWGFATWEYFPVAAILPRIFRKFDTEPKDVFAQDRSDFLAELRLEAGSEYRQMYDELEELYGGGDVAHRQLMLEAIVSKGALNELCATGNEQIWGIQLDIPAEIDAFLGRDSGSKSGLTAEDILQF